MPSIATSRFSVRFFGVLGVFFLCGIAYGQSAAGGPYPRPMTAGEARDYAYLLPKLKPGQAYVLNLAEPHQRSIARRGLMLANRTPRNAPQTHAALQAEVQSQLQQARGAGNDPAALAPRPLKAETPGDMQDIAAIEMTAVEGKTQYTATGYSSVYGGTIQTTITVQLVDTKSQTIYARASGTQYGQGTNFSVSVTGAVASAANLEAVATIDTTEDRTCAITTVKTPAMYGASKATMTAPNYCARNQPGNPSSNCVIDSKSQTKYESESITPPRQDRGAIKICFNRGSQDACDYFNSTNRPTNGVFFPTAGTASFGANIDASKFAKEGKYSTIIIDELQGGGCIFEADAPLGSGWSLPSANTVQWNLPQLSLTNPTTCLRKVNKGRLVDFTFVVKVPLVSSRMGEVTFSSDLPPSPRPPGYNLIPQLHLEDSCVAAGTLVRLADGSEAAIETLSADDSRSVRTATGETRTVLGTGRGVELHPMIRLETNRGQSLLLTRTHPVLTVHGPVMALDLKAGDRVRTEKGVAAIVSITTEEYAGQVHSLRLGWFDEAKTDRRTYSANGIFIGDSVTQQQLEQEEVARVRSDKAHVMRRLPNDEWRAEYKTFVARQR